MRRSTTLAGRFQLGEAAGTGGTGTVYRATDAQTGQVVAAKVIAVEDVLDTVRFERESTSLAALGHPGIVRYVAHGVSDDGEHFLVMEWIDGESLAELLARDGLTIRESVHVVMQVAHALAEAHAQGVIHRDIKPDNIMLDGGVLDRVRVVDFGLARAIEDDQRLTRTGTTMGTPGYMAPEQARGARDLDGRTDMFALGCVLYECISGRAPFMGENPMAVQLKVLMIEPMSLRAVDPHVPAPLWAVVKRMLAKDPAARFADMTELAAALAALPALPDDMRHPTVMGAPSTTKLGIGVDTARPPASCVVMAAPPRPNPTWAARAWDATNAWRDQAEMLKDNVVVVRHAGAIEAAHCAIAIAGALPEATVVISTPPPDGAGGLEGAIDRSTQVMSVAALRAVFARGAVAGKIHVDPVTASLLRAQFEIVRDGDGLLLRGVRHG